MAVEATRMVPNVRELGEIFGSSTAHYVLKLESTDGVLTAFIIFGSGAPSTNFNDATVGASLYIDTANGKVYTMTAAATWTVVGAQS